jgi:hypothetical protein
VSWLRRKPPDPAAVAAERAKAQRQDAAAHQPDAGDLSLAPDPPRPSASGRRRWLRGWTAAVAGVVVLLLLVAWPLCWYWSREPAPLYVNDKTPDGRTVVGYSTADTLARVIEWMLNKPGGYLSNDIAPPSAWLDNMPSFEFGVLVQCRDLARVLRNSYSRSQSQSVEDRDLIVAEPDLNFTNDRWIVPSTEGKYEEALEALDRYKARLVDENPNDAYFFARADNLREWLSSVEGRLGSLSQRLSASVGQVRVNTDLGGSASGESNRTLTQDVVVKTPWLEIDDVFYEARGSAWALLVFLRAAQFDFERVLEDKNAVVSLRQIIRELEEALAPVRSPIIMNGAEYGLTPNHSLVLASYLSRAHSAVADLRELLERG